jgi:hypothetical protein
MSFYLTYLVTFTLRMGFSSRLPGSRYTGLNKGYCTMGHNEKAMKANSKVSTIDIIRAFIVRINANSLVVSITRYLERIK